MVLSRLEETVDYVESKIIHKSDNNLSFEVYLMQVEFPSTIMREIEVILGTPKQLYVEYEMMQIPIYVVDEEQAIECIGLFEVKMDTVDTTILNTDSYSIDKLGQPLLFTRYVDETYLKQFTSEGRVERKKNRTNDLEEVDMDAMEPDDETTNVENIQTDDDEDENKDGNNNNDNRNVFGQKIK
jgi:hypothetical protein